MWLPPELLNNPIMAGGMGLGLVGGIMAYLRNIPGTLWAAIKRQCIVSVEIPAGGQLFYMVSRWLDNHPYMQKSRLLSAYMKWDHGEEPAATAQIIFTPAPGDHIIRFQGRLIWLTRNREKSAYGNIDSFTLKTIGRSQDVFRKLLQQVEEHCKNTENKNIRIFMIAGSSWDEVTMKEPRPLDSIILPGEIKTDIVGDIQTFMNSFEWYKHRGLPYRRGYLLYGPPGSGKSSFIGALAGVVKRDLYILNLSAKDLDDQTLQELLATVPPTGVILIEDVDAAFATREKNKDDKNNLTFSGLLNALDGVGTKDGQIVFLTTNHIDLLDPALIRPGRCDVKVLMDYAQPSQAAEIFLRFFGGSKRAEEFGQSIDGRQVTMATIQAHLLAYRDNEHLALELVPWRNQ